MNLGVKQGTRLFTLVTLMVMLVAQAVMAHPGGSMTQHKAAGTEIATPALGGYDPVAYFEVGRPVRGSGYHTATYEGATYLFASKDHQEMFQANPAKYAPRYGGYCAYGVAVGKKFFADPHRWKIVDGRLYLNLDRDIQDKWNQDIPGYIAKADSNWKDIENKNPADL